MRLRGLALVMVVAACGGGTNPTAPPGVAVPRPGDDEWPFTVPSGWVACMPAPRDLEYVYLVVGDDQLWYGLNGTARGSGLFLDARDILEDGRTPADTQPYIDLGLTVCSSTA